MEKMVIVYFFYCNIFRTMCGKTTTVELLIDNVFVCTEWWNCSIMIFLSLSLLLFSSLRMNLECVMCMATATTGRLWHNTHSHNVAAGTRLGRWQKLNCAKRIFGECTEANTIFFFQFQSSLSSSTSSVSFDAPRTIQQRPRRFSTPTISRLHTMLGKWKKFVRRKKINMK